MRARGRPEVALRDDDGREDFALAAERSHAQADVVMGAAAEALVKTASRGGVLDLLQGGEQRGERSGHSGLGRHALLTAGGAGVEVLLDEGLPGAERTGLLADYLGLVVPPSEPQRVGPPRVLLDALDLFSRHHTSLERQRVLRAPREPVVVAGLRGAEVALGVRVGADQERHARGHVWGDQVGAGLVVA